MIEVELKFALLPTSWQQLQKRIEPIHLTGKTKNDDIYYDTAQFDLLRQAVFVRVRNHTHLEFKFNEEAAPAHIQCAERLFPLASEQQMDEINLLFAQFLPQWHSAPTMHDLFHNRGLIELVHIENQRTQYQYNEITLCVDCVNGLGNFVEMEMQCEEESETQQAEAYLQRFAESLTEDLEMRQVRIGYVELWLQKHRPQVYRLGKYQE